MWKKIVLVIAIILLVVGLGLVLFPPISTWYGKQVSHGQAENFDRVLEHVVPADGDSSKGVPGVTEKTFAAALEKKQIDEEGYPIDENGVRTGDTQVVFELDLDRLYRDSVAYNEDLKVNQGSKFIEGESYENPALDLRQYGVYDNIYGYVSAPSIGMMLPIYLGASDRNMSYGAAHMTYSSLPLDGIDTNCAVVGHTGYIGRIFFDNIRRLEIGDTVSIRNYWQNIDYQVIDYKVVTEKQTSDIYIQKDRQLLTQITCIYSGHGDDFDRYLVICEKKD